MDLKYILLIMGLVLLVVPGAALDGYAFSQSIAYTACDQEIYQQDIVIHRTNSTNYEETVGGLNVWHIFVGEHCREDYGDIRFTNSTGAELAYYLWPDYSSESARVCVRLEGADAAGVLQVWYGNPSAETASDGDATFLFSEEFPTGALDPEKWTEDAVGSITDTRTGDGMDKITGGTVSGSSYWIYDIIDSANQHHAKVALPASYTIEWENTVSTLSANQMGQGGVGLVSGTSKIVVFAGHGDWRGDTFAARRDIIHETGSLVRYNGYTQGESAYQTRKATSSETKIPYKIRVANNDVAVTINNQLACTFTKTTAISKLAILAGTYGGYPFVTYIGISNLRVRAYSATPPAALTFFGEQVSGAAPPRTTFTATPTTGLAPLTVQFTDISIGSPTSWAWAFGDGGTSSQQSPSHTYAAPGTYTVTLTVSNAIGSNVMTKTDYIIVKSAPTNVNMDIPYNKTLLDTPMWFNATADGATSWFWEFGDGTNSTAQNVSKSFTTEGDYFVTLTATNEFGDTTIGREIIVMDNVFASDGVGWTQATASAGWSARSGHTSVVYDGKMWVMGGSGYNDVWWSTDGITWTRATASAKWSGRYGHTSVVYDGKMWVMGGFDGSYKRDVWWSTDGITWTRATASAGWSGRYEHTSVVYDGKMWVMGGYDGSRYNDVWWSTDGIMWTRATASAGWSVRNDHTSVVYDGKMWVMGGYTGSRKNDVWRSTDGITWTQATASAKWSARYGHTSVVYDGKMWVMGGYTGSTRYNDVWWSTDGITWTQATASAGWSTRSGHTSVVYDGKMWVMGGDDGSRKNDVWRTTVGEPIVQPSPPLMPQTAIPFSTPLDYYNHTSYLWDFGDGQTATGTNPAHTYATAGTYTVTLTMPDEVNGIQTVYTKEVTIGGSPTAAFTANTTAGLTPLAVQFTDESTGNPTSWSWTFGDGGTATTQNPTHIYTTAGTYSVNLTVTNAYGTDSLVKSDYITVQSLATVAFAANQTSVYAYDPIQFTDQSTGDNITAWAWSFGDGETSTDQNPVHSYTTEGTYTVTLNVTNPAGTATLTKSNYVAVNPVPPPTVVFTANRTTVYPDEPVLFTDQSTNDRFPIQSWNWSFGDDTWVNQTVNEPVTHAYAEPGSYTVELFVTGYGGTASKTTTITVNAIPVPTVAFTANKTTVYPNETILFTDKTTTTDNFPMYTWNWSFGDGAWINQSVNDSVTYAYDEPGTYTVELFVTGYGGTASKTKTVTVDPIPVPTVQFTVNRSTVYPNETILFTDTSTSEFPMTAWNWSFGDDTWVNQTTSGSVEHAYVAPGSYDVTLYVTGEGGVGSKTTAVTVIPFPVPIVQFAANVTEEVRPMSVQFTDQSTYEPYQWYWDFGDGYDSTDQNPVHTYRYEGTYAVTLTAWNVNGQNSTTKTGYITVNLPPLPTLRDLHIQNNGVTVTDYQIPYEVTNDDEFFGLLQSNPAHLEVYNGAGDQSYYFWIESFNTMTNSSKIWIKIPTLTGGGATTQVRLKYNDDRDVPLSDGDHTFLLFDAFDTVGINDEEWTVGGTPTQSVGSLRLATGDSLVSTPQYPYHSIAIDARVRTGGSDLDLALSTAGTNWKSAGDGFGLTVNGDLTARAINDGSVTTETVPIAADTNYHVYTIYEIDNNLVYQRDGITQKVIGTNQPDTNMNAVLQGDGEVDWIFVRKFSTQDYVYLVPPQAAFTADIVKGVAPLTVNFTDTSLNSPTAWAWDFGDGQTSIEQHPTHTFTEVGNYTVTLTATNLRGSDTYTATIQAVALIAIPEFGANITKGVAPLTVQFTDQSENVTAWAWNFGDGQTSIDQHPVHTFSNIGNWTVTLTGTNLHGSNTTSMVIAATLPPPVANFSQNVTAGDEPLTVQFTDCSENSPDRWSWTFGDGETSTEQHPVHTYVDGGSYPVSLTVSSFAGTDTLTVPAAVTVGNVYVEPVAAFAASATTVDKGSAIKFTDQSTNEPLSWSWQFGDGQTSTSQNPTHTYTTPGTYSVTLTVTNPAGSNATTTAITVLEKMPVAAFSGTPRAGDHPLTVQFTDQTSNNPTQWSWDFGDGLTSTEQNPTHTYTAAGAYTVTLTATNARGTDDEVKPEYIRVDVPDVAFTANVTDGNKPLIVQFTDESTKQPTAWLWNFGDGQTSTEQNPVHTYTTAGMKTVTLTATNANGAATLTRTNYITVVELRPVASFTAPVSIDRYQYAYFTDQSTNNPTKWEWSFGDGATYTTSDYRYKSPSHRYTTPGTYTVTLKVTNAIGSDTTTRSITVNQIPPNAAFTATNTFGDAPLTVQFTDQSSREPIAWLWDFGDGNTSTEQHPAHTYTVPGTYSVTLTIQNTAGSAAVTKTDLVVLNTPAVAMTVDPAVGEKPLTVRFTDQSTNEPISWLWKFGDGATSTEQHPTHIYTAAGVYTVTLTATNAYGTTTKSFPAAVTVYELAPAAAFTANVTEGDKPLSVQFTDLSANNPTQWSWTFGDGGSSNQRNPVHTYTAPGLYTVTLTATNPKGSGSVTRTNYITVEEIPPVAAFTVDHTYMIAGQDIRFTDQSQNSPTTWFWQFGDGQTSSLKNPRHAYAAPGTYTVTLRVTNEKGQSDLVKINYITVDIHLPIADFDCNPVLGAAPLTVTFTDESEFLPYQWYWQFGDGVTSTVQHPTHTYTEPGTYSVTLRASNAVGSDTMTKTDVIVVQLPEINFTASPTMGGSPLTVQFTTDGSPDWSYHWSFGDGATSNEQNPTHVYKTTQDQQFYTVSLTVAYGGEEQEIVKPNYIDVRTKSIETFMAEQQENIGAVVTIGAVMATIAGIIVIYLGL